jgi:phosphatidate phosphatase APP1
MPILHEQSTKPWTSWEVLWKYLNNINTKGSPLVMDLRQKTFEGEKTVDRHKKKQEMETNLRSLQSNP